MTVGIGLGNMNHIGAALLRRAGGADIEAVVVNKSTRADQSTLENCWLCAFFNWIQRHQRQGNTGTKVPQMLPNQQNSSAIQIHSKSARGFAVGSLSDA